VDKLITGGGRSEQPQEPHVPDVLSDSCRPTARFVSISIRFFSSSAAITASADWSFAETDDACPLSSVIFFSTADLAACNAMQQQDAPEPSGTRITAVNSDSKASRMAYQAQNRWANIVSAWREDVHSLEQK
jgi:hypothetical protein